MARKPTPAPAVKESTINEVVLQEGSAALNTLAVIELSKQEYGQGRDLANQMLGQIQMSRAISKFTDVVSLSKLQYIKENKIYRCVAGQKATDAAGNEIADVGTWEGFCAALGCTRSKIDEDLTNLKVFGQEALDQMQSTGIGYRQMRQFRQLPLDAKTELIEAAKAGDTDTLLELAEDLIAKHIKEKTGLEQELAAKDQRIAKHVATIAAHDDAADRLAVQPVHALVADSAARALGVVRGELRDGFEKLHAHHRDNNSGGAGVQAVMAGYVAELQQALNELREAFVLEDPVGDGTPAWKKWADANPVDAA